MTGDQPEAVDNLVEGLEHGHKGAFKTMALDIGLEGKMTATRAGEKLTGK